MLTGWLDGCSMRRDLSDFNDATEAAQEGQLKEVRESQKRQQEADKVCAKAHATLRDECKSGCSKKRIEEIVKKCARSKSKE